MEEVSRIQRFKRNKFLLMEPQSSSYDPPENIPKKLTKRQSVLQASRLGSSGVKPQIFSPEPPRRKCVRRRQKKNQVNVIPVLNVGLKLQPEPIARPYMVSPLRTFAQSSVSVMSEPVDEKTAMALEQDLDSMSTRGVRRIPLSDVQSSNVPQYITVQTQSKDVASAKLPPQFLPVIDVATDYTSLIQQANPIMLQPQFYLFQAQNPTVPILTSGLEVKQSKPPTPKKKNQKQIEVVDLTDDSDSSPANSILNTLPDCGTSSSTLSGIHSRKPTDDFTALAQSNITTKTRVPILVQLKQLEGIVNDLNNSIVLTSKP